MVKRVAYHAVTGALFLNNFGRVIIFQLFVRVDEHEASDQVQGVPCRACESIHDSCLLLFHIPRFYILAVSDHSIDSYFCGIEGVEAKTEQKIVGELEGQYD